MSVFRFKQFEVQNSRSAMKLGTDSVLLGALAGLPEDESSRVLDIGSGTGVVALMLAQRLNGRDFHIDGVEIDKESALEMEENFRNSPWAERLSAIHSPLQAWKTELKYSLIVSNPPYFDSSLTNPDPRKADARHCLSLGIGDICSFARENLKPEGRLFLILPADCEKRLMRTATSFDLELQSIVRVRTSPGKALKRIVAGFGRQKPEKLLESEFRICAEGGFSQEYKSVLKDFLLAL